MIPYNVESIPFRATSTAVYQTVIFISGQSNSINLDFSQLAVQAPVSQQDDLMSEAYETMLASEAILSRDWDTPEEDAAWAYL